MSIALKGPPHGIAACIGYHVTVFRAALSSHEVVSAADLVHMRGFEVSSARTAPDIFACGKLFACFNIDLALGNSLNAVIVSAVADKISMTVIKEERGVDSALLDYNRFGPFAIDIVREDVKVFTCRGVCCHHVESSVVESDSGSIYAA